ncbi:transposase [Deinococcus aquiradiocola]|uniref:Transposase n=1 Tax=Deinococcus aquiradiocola TaxID=393059 RepID=A0A917PPX6_9DEIO|nr:transposase [Deinococcus aquiradiocola]GGJ87250.1 hypothetical protein GCM10008939_34120 [Deinococcus aquiradiocola]
MKAGIFTEEQIVALLQNAQKGEKTVEELCRDLGCSTASFYTWKKRYGDASGDGRSDEMRNAGASRGFFLERSREVFCRVLRCVAILCKRGMSV